MRPAGASGSPLGSQLFEEAEEVFEVASTAEGLFAAEFLVHGFPRGDPRPEVRCGSLLHGVAVFNALEVVGAQAGGVVAPRGYGAGC
jgi:hypothetical protein